MAGEDISFDIGFAAKYKSKVFIVDPTPRAVTPGSKVLERVGAGAQQEFVAGGCQDPSSYDLSGIEENQVNLIKLALWREKCKIKFFAPSNPAHVSHSIVNYQNNYSQASESIEVDAVTLGDLCSDKLSISSIEILKLDIEGAEHEVISSMLSSELRPKQVLVEYDELLVGSFRGLNRFRKTHRQLLLNGYKLFSRDGANYSYILARTT